MERSIDSLERAAVARGLGDEQADRLLTLILAVKLEGLLERGVQNPMERRELLHRWLDAVLFELEESRGGL